MIRIQKNISDIPISLRVDNDSLLTDPAKTTNSRRLEVIAMGKYPDSCESKKYDSRYKYPDIKERLMIIYHGKCAFCETAMEQLQVEHYRPKRGGYFWLAYSWDNLLLSCPTCNIAKSSFFPTEENRVQYVAGDVPIQRIHSLSNTYDRIEKPLLINPETASKRLLGSAMFNRQGQMFSQNARMKETIRICRLDRKALRENRKSIWDDLEKQIRFAVLESNGDATALKASIKSILRFFKEKTKCESSPYISYREFILHSGWIKEII